MVCFFVFCFVFLLFLWAAPMAYGGSQARGRRMVNPLNEGRDQTRNLMVSSQIR